MKVFAHWIGLSTFGARSTRDAYVGAPGEGHVVHYVVGTSDAFEAREVSTAARARPERPRSAVHELLTLGLSPPQWTEPDGATLPSLGPFRRFIEPGAFDVTPPYSPFVRLTPPDEYWAAKRLLDAGDGMHAAGLAAARYPEDAAHRLTDALRARRRTLVVHGLSAVTPLDPTATSGRSVWLRDRAIASAITPWDDTRYRVELLDVEGGALAAARSVDASGPVTAVRIPDDVDGRVVVRVLASRRGQEAPRPCDVHLIVDRGEVRIIGVRH